MNIYNFFSSYEILIKRILLICIVIILVLVFFSNDYLKITTTSEPKETSKATTSEPKETSKATTVEPKETSKTTISELKETSKNTISEPKETSKATTVELKETSKTTTSEPKETPDSIAIIISKIISDENLNSNQILFNSYEEEEWNSYALGCPMNGKFYALSIVKGFKISVDINDKENIIHADQNLNYINCTKIKNENSNANYNFYEQYDLENTQKITLVLNSSEKILSTLEDKAKVKLFTKSLDQNINIIKVDYCDSTYTIIFSNESKDIKFRVACEGNLNYVETEEPLETTDLFIKILEDLLSTLEFPGMPSNE